MTKHAKLSASGSSKWLNCPGSINAEEGYEDKSSIYAKEGTLAHALADKCLKKEKEAEYYIGKKINKEIIEKDMAQYVQEYLDYVLSHETDTSELMTEQKVDYSNIYPKQFGTLDAAVINFKSEVIHIFDLKYGKGVKVNAFENTQAQLYAVGLYNELNFLYDFKKWKFKLHIVQPRINHFDDWDILVKDLMKFIKIATEKAELAMTKNAPRVPGEKQCQWCKAKASCQPLAKFVEDTLMCEFENLDEIENQVLTNERRKIIQDNKYLVESFLKANQDSIFKILESEQEFDGYKLVEGRSIRKWTNEAEIELYKKLRKDAYEQKLIGITAAQKLIGKEEIDKLTFKPKGKLTLVQESDKRKAIIMKSIVDEFEEIKS